MFKGGRHGKKNDYADRGYCGRAEIKPRRSQIRRRVRIEKGHSQRNQPGDYGAERSGFIRVGFLVYDVMNSRTGGLGGEILVFPALALAFGFGYEIGARNERKQWEADEDGENEYRTAGTGGR